MSQEVSKYSLTMNYLGMTKFTTPVLLLFLSFIASSIYGQEIDCVRSAMLSGNMNYVNTGTAYLERFDDGRIQLRLSDDFEATDINTDVRP